MMIGETRTRLPGCPSEGYLSDLADQLEACPMPDEYRTMANALADWKAKDFRWIQDDETLLYELRFHITAPDYEGPVTIAYSRAQDSYSLITAASNSEGSGSGSIRNDDIYFDELSTHLGDLAGDAQTWCHVCIEPLAKAA